jgi:hypothetical protein
LNGNISLSTSAQTTLKNIMYPLGIVVERFGNTNPSDFFGGTWTLVGVTGVKYHLTNVNSSCIASYEGQTVSVQIACNGHQLGNVSQTYNFGSNCGFTFDFNDPNKIIPMYLMCWTIDGSLKFVGPPTNFRIYKKSAYEIEVDSLWGSTVKSDYVMAFSARISDFSKAATTLGSTCITKWRRIG